jgi:hypothetical protein
MIEPCSNCGEPCRNEDPDAFAQCELCTGMRNKAMARKLRKGEAVDVSGFNRTPDGDYRLPDFADGMDYCDARDEEWIWSIGRYRHNGVILASRSNKFYPSTAEVECLWLR